jgi:ribose transport system ATP-binding protein
MPHLFPALIAKGLSQTYGNGKVGLTATDLTIDPGIIHVVVGQSGAGKTTLADLLAGVIHSPSGSIHLQGQLTILKDEHDALQKGIRYAKQFWDVHNRQSVADSLDLGPVPRRFGLVDTYALHERASAHLKMYGLSDVDPKARVCDLPIGQQKLLQLAACLSKPATLLILDDPTASLTEIESQVLFDRLAQLQYAQTGILYLTSSAQEALEVGDQISVLRDGQLLTAHNPHEVFLPQITGEMVGRDLSQTPQKANRIYGPEVSIRIEGMSTGPRIVGFSLKAKRGEIVGLVGLQGAGQSDVLKAAAGVEPKNDGAVFMRGSAVPSHVGTRVQALISGLGFIPEPWGHAVAAVPGSAGIVGRQSLRSLNSANPQKAQIAACLAAGCSVLLFDNPTRGLNVACRLEVHQAIQEIADQGVTIIASSTDVDELVRFCDRICVMAHGIVIRTFERPAFDVEKIRSLLKNPK